MKKFVAAFLCLIILLSLFSCANDNIKDNGNNDTNDINNNTPKNETTNTTSVNYVSVLEVYRIIVEKFPIVNQNPRAVAAELGIQDEAEIEAFVNLYSSIHLFYPGIGQEDSVSPHHKLGCGYSVKDLNGDGVDELVLMNKDYYIMAIFSYSNEKPVLLGNYWERNSCWIDGDGLLHNNGSSGADRSTSAIYKIADGGESLELISEFGTNGHEWVDDVAYTKYYKVVGSEKVSIIESEYNALVEQYGKYLGSVASAETTKEYSGLTFTSLYTEAEIAMEMYEAVLKNEVKVYETDIEEYNHLKDCKTPYNRIPLCELESLRYVYMDVDGDSINELVINCGDTLILRYYEGTVYIYSFIFRNLYYLNTDGSYSWNYTESDFEYGENQIYFEGATLKTRELWRIVNDGEPDAEYYIGDKQVTKEDILKYIEDNPKTRIEFSSLEVSWQKNITNEEALQIASEYWEIEDGFTDYGVGSMWVYRILILDSPSSAFEYYHIGLQVDHYGKDRNDRRILLESKMEYLFVNAATGECQDYASIYGGK